jgi:hypothetical protein
MMLAELEKKTAALIADNMAARDHFSVTAAPGPPNPANEGLEAAVVSIAEASTAGAFVPERFASQSAPAQSRRVLPLAFVAGVDFAIHPTNNPAGLAAARNLLLEDISLVSHFLSSDGISSGSDFSIADPDPGFRVRSFRVTRNLVNRDLQQGMLTARIECQGEADIWPPGPAQAEGKIDAIRPVIVPQPIEILPLHPVVAMGGSVRLQVRGLPAQRRKGPPAEPLAISVRVLSDAPPNQRGSIGSGVAGAETGSRVVTVTAGSADVQYVAPPAGVSGMRVEFVSIFLATPQGKVGAFLGSVAVRVMGGND